MPSRCKSLAKIERKHVIIVAIVFNLFVAKMEWDSLKRRREVGRRVGEKKDSEDVKLLRLRVEEREKEIHEIEKHYNATMQQREKRLPRVIGVGVKKCGTSGLIRFLSYHPLVKAPWDVETETFFFNQKTANHSLEYYRSLFSAINDREIAIEKTPQYFDDLPHDLPETIAKTIPGVKLLLMVCDPAWRVYSDFVHERNRLKVYNKTWLNQNYSNFDEFVNDYLNEVEVTLKRMIRWQLHPLVVQRHLTGLFGKTDLSPLLITSGLYYFHIQRWLRVFNRSDLMIINGEEFLKDPGSILEQVQDFLNISKLVWKEDFVKNPQTGLFCHRKITRKHLEDIELGKNSTSSIECLVVGKGRTRASSSERPNEETIRRLKEFYKPYNEKFFKLMKKDFNWD